MKTYSELLDLVNEKIRKYYFFSRCEPTELYEPIRYILSIGGKRVRPVMVLMAANLFNENVTPALNAAMAIESFHNFTLMHDDIMDKSDMRRNVQTVHTKWNNNIAILSGDALCIKAYELLAKVPAGTLSNVLPIFTETALQVCEGQQYDMNFEHSEIVSIDNYLKMIELKTSVLIAASLQIGAIIGGASNDDAKKLYEFGLNVGLAFQIQDDWLDVYGEPKTFGKPIGNDIVSNKKTFLLINALNIAKGETKQKLLQLIRAKEFDADEKYEAVVDIYNQLNINEITQAKISDYYQLALQSYKSVNVDNVRKKTLEDFVGKLMDRKV